MTWLFTDAAKSDLRAAALARRDALDAARRAAAGQAIAARGLPVSVPDQAIVSGFWPIRSEIDPRPLMKALACQGARLALPVIGPRDAPLTFRAWTDDAPLKPGPLGISQPPAEAEQLFPDIVLVPLAAFDRAGHRIGYGAGLYDRTLADLRARKSVIAIGVAFAVQEIAYVPATAHDARLDFMLTDIETIDFRSP
ncbi:MAG: 5-formyltetrahydrofolate cyclo-ligase [Tardiphaga sp.]|nr:5-formyltetrahydrofolate cyclo-ligase [Tardiphaga sp.]